MVPQSEPQQRKPSILLVEDETLIRVILSDELRMAGLTVVEATTADEALSYLQTAGMVDLVFTDIQMPGSMNGLELARNLRKQNPSLPIIITSGNAAPKAADGIGQFMPKPYDMEQAVKVICTILGLPPAGEDA